MQRFKMVKPGVCNLFGIVFVMTFQFVLQGAFFSDYHQVEKPDILRTNQDVNEYNKQETKYSTTAAGSRKPSVKLGERQTIQKNPFLNRFHRSTSTDLLTSQFEQLCVNIGSQPCTCYYPDHRDVTRFELSTDEITMNASAEVNGTGPSNCTDVRNLGHYLNGFYMVRFNNKQAKAIYCEFQQVKKGNQKDNEIIENSIKKDEFSGSSKDIKFCGDVRININGCPFLYSDNPDAPISFQMIKGGNNTNNVYNFSTGEPRGCEDLRSIGYTLKGFYLVRLNALKVKTIYCDFQPMILGENNKSKTKRFIQVKNRTKSRFCSRIGSQPCSCYYHSKFPKTLQLELSSDETTRNASVENGTGPASCEDLKLIGHSLNGFYIVRSIDKAMKTVFCKFFQLNQTTTTIQPTISRSSRQSEHVISKAIESNLQTSKAVKITKSGTVEELKNTERPPTSLKQNENTFLSSLKADGKTQTSTPISEPLGVTSALLRSQFEEQCLNIGNQPCTCYYPDHPDVIKFELSKDNITMNASDPNGTGPANCTDLKNLGHSLNGFYMVRFNNKRTKVIYCEFQHVTEQLFKETSATKNSFKSNHNSGSSKHLRLCGDVRTNFTRCTFLYPDNPDTPKFELTKKLKNAKNTSSLNRGEPTTCEDLRAIGYTMAGLYLVRLNAIKIKTVYCHFNAVKLENVNKLEDRTSIYKNKSRFCSTIGSAPCSCIYSKFSNILQLELSNDELTRIATAENGIGPGSCKDLESIGYNLNGFYMIRAKEKKMTTVFCEFEPNDEATTTVKPRTRQKITEPLKKTSLQTNIRTPKPAPLMTKPVSTNDEIKQLSTTKLTLIPVVYRTQKSLNLNNNFMKPTLKSNFGTPASTLLSKNMVQTTATESTFKPEILQLTTARPEVNLNQKLELNHPFGRSYPLMNKNGKCLAVETTGIIKQSENGATIIQADCNPSEKGQLWKWDRIKSRLCNEWKKCLSLPFNYTQGITNSVFQWDLIDGEKRQKWVATSTDQFNNIGWCLAFEGNSNNHGAKAKREYCNDQENGQIWSFVWFENSQNLIQSNSNIKTTTKWTRSVIKKVEFQGQLTTAMAKISDIIITSHETVQLTTGGTLTIAQALHYINDKIFIQLPARSVVQLNRKIPLNHPHGRSYLLMNNHGKCLAVETTGTINPSENGAKIIQADCNPSEKGQLWKWDRMKNLLCNDWNKCLSVPFNFEGGLTKDVFHWDLIKDERRQQWVALGTNQFLIFGHCLAFEGNSDAHGARAMTNYCNGGDKGQIWIFAWF